MIAKEEEPKSNHNKIPGSFNQNTQTMNNLLKTTDSTKHRSVETTFLQLIMKEFVKNMTKSANNIFYKYTDVRDI